MSAQSDLYAHYVAAAGTLADTETRLECLDEIEQWNAARTAIAAVSGGVSSYSINGRSVTRRDLAQLRAEAAGCETRFKRLMYGGNVLIADMTGVGL